MAISRRTRRKQRKRRRSRRTKKRRRRYSSGHRVKYRRKKNRIYGGAVINSKDREIRGMKVCPNPPFPKVNLSKVVYYGQQFRLKLPGKSNSKVFEPIKLLGQGAYGQPVVYRLKDSKPEKRIVIKFETGGSEKRIIKYINSLNKNINDNFCGAISAKYLQQMTLRDVRNNLRNIPGEPKWRLILPQIPPADRLDVILLEYCDGTLDQLSVKSGTISMKNVVNILISVIFHIKCLLSQKLYYTDMKAANIFYKCTNKNKFKIFIGDLGSCAQEGEDGEIFTYPPPEIARVWQVTRAGDGHNEFRARVLREQGFLPWRCKSCGARNRSYLHACEYCDAPNPRYDQAIKAIADGLDQAYPHRVNSKMITWGIGALALALIIGQQATKVLYWKNKDELARDPQKSKARIIDIMNSNYHLLPGSSSLYNTIIRCLDVDQNKRLNINELSIIANQWEASPSAALRPRDPTIPPPIPRRKSKPPPPPPGKPPKKKSVEGVGQKPKPSKKKSAEGVGQKPKPPKGLGRDDANEVLGMALLKWIEK